MAVASCQKHVGMRLRNYWESRGGRKTKTGCQTVRTIGKRWFFQHLPPAAVVGQAASRGSCAAAERCCAAGVRLRPAGQRTWQGRGSHLQPALVCVPPQCTSLHSAVSVKSFRWLYSKANHKVVCCALTTISLFVSEGCQWRMLILLPNFTALFWHKLQPRATSLLWLEDQLQQVAGLRSSSLPGFPLPSSPALHCS